MAFVMVQVEWFVINDLLVVYIEEKWFALVLFRTYKMWQRCRHGVIKSRLVADRKSWDQNKFTKCVRCDQIMNEFHEIIIDCSSRINNFSNYNYCKLIIYCQNRETAGSRGSIQATACWHAVIVARQLFSRPSPLCVETTLCSKIWGVEELQGEWPFQIWPVLLLSAASSSWVEYTDLCEQYSTYTNLYIHKTQVFRSNDGYHSTNDKTKLDTFCKESMLR